MEKIILQGSLTGAEKLIWNTHYKFHLEMGKTEKQAYKDADEKIRRVREMGRTLKFKY